MTRTSDMYPNDVANHMTTAEFRASTLYAGWQTGQQAKRRPRPPKPPAMIVAAPALQVGQVYSMELPFFAPSINHYWEHNRSTGATYIGKRGRVFRKLIADFIMAHQLAGFVGGMWVDVALILCPPTTAVHDCDNYCKSLFDALTKAQFWSDDNQIKSMRVVMGDVTKRGKMTLAVRIHVPTTATAAELLNT